jgi:GH25 family lysozyme M1 (1,4-beta-N-acetylmuramidase)
MLFGSDVSAHQGTVDFRAMRTGNDFMYSIVKCTEGAEEGTPFLDAKFNENWAKLLDLPPDDPEVGMYRGAYHFARYDNRQGQGESGGENEAKWFCKNMKRVGGYGQGCLPPALDLEVWEGTAENNLAFVRGFIRVVEAELGRSPMFYTGVNTWASSHFNDSDEFVDYDLWEVKYQSNGWEENAEPPPMTKRNDDWPWIIWQWSGGSQWDYYRQKFGPIAGVPSGNCDVNRFNGTYEDMGRLLATPRIVDGGTDPEPPPVDSLTSPLVLPNEVDLNALRGKTSGYVARVQGLLLGHGYGPDGLVGSNGLPDGRFGDKTQGYLGDFKAKNGIPGPASLMTLGTWNKLVVLALS